MFENTSVSRGKDTGLKVNKQKTEIIIINKHKASDSFIQTYSQIGEITDEASHLGLQIDMYKKILGSPHSLEQLSRTGMESQT